jgi:hypothetical protein
MSSHLRKLSAFRLLFLAVSVSLTTGCLGDPDAGWSDDVEMEAAALTTTMPLYLRQLTLFEDGETGSSPEIYVICKTQTGRWSSRKDLEYVDDTDHSYTPNIRMMDVSSTEWPVTCEVWEGDNNATGQDFIGYGVFTQAAVTGTTSTACAQGSHGDMQMGVSKVRGPNTCPGAELLGIVCDQKCTNIRWY